LVTLKINDKRAAEIKKLAVEQSLETIRNRVDQFGITEPEIIPQGVDRIIVQLPGIKDTARAKSLIGRTALLEFKLVDEEHGLEEALKGNIPEGSIIAYESRTDRTSGRRSQNPILLKGKSLMTGDALESAKVQIGDRFGEPHVSIKFNAQGAKDFDRITGDNVKKRLAIILDGMVHSAPVIQERISGGQAQITGSFTMEEATDLAIVLRAGALPAPVVILEERTVGPSLGQDSIDKGTWASIIAGILILIFMVIYYRLSGLVADVARHRRHRADHGHGRRRQCPDQRADSRRAPPGEIAQGGRRGRLYKGLFDHLRLQCDDPCSGAVPLRFRHGSGEGFCRHTDNRHCGQHVHRHSRHADHL
jgi:preprotein translocase subunit SecD